MRSNTSDNERPAERDERLERGRTPTRPRQQERREAEEGGRDDGQQEQPGLGMRRRAVEDDGIADGGKHERGRLGQRRGGVKVHHPDAAGACGVAGG